MKHKSISKILLYVAAILLCTEVYSQEKEFKRFSVGISYSFKDRIKEMGVERPKVYPMELSFRYNLTDKHSLHLDVPFGWRNDEEWYKEDVLLYIREKRLYGIGLGYDYNIIDYKNLYLFAGGGLEYQRFKSRQTDIFKDVMIGAYTYSGENFWYNDYAIYPEIGFRYVWRFIGIEAKYRCYFSITSYDQNIWLGYDHPQYEESDHNGYINHSFRCGLFFIF